MHAIDNMKILLMIRALIAVDAWFQILHLQHKWDKRNEGTMLFMLLYLFLRIGGFMYWLVSYFILQRFPLLLQKIIVVFYILLGVSVFVFRLVIDSHTPDRKKNFKQEL